MRREFSAKTKTAVAQRANGRCEICTRLLLYGEAEYDHRIPCNLGGDDSLGNCVYTCKSCHKAKTKNDVRDIAKAKRNYRRAHGIRKASRFACSRNSKFKKKIDGSVVPR